MLGAGRRRRPVPPLSDGRPRRKGPDIVDLDVALPRKPLINTGRRRTGKSAKAADTSAESTVAKSTNVTGKAAKAKAAKAKAAKAKAAKAKAARARAAKAKAARVAAKAASVEKATLDDDDDYEARGPLKKRKWSARVASQNNAKASSKARKDASKAASMAATDEHPSLDDNASKSGNSAEISVATNAINKKLRATPVAPVKRAKAAAEASPEIDDDPNNDALTMVSLSWSISFEIVN
jgi:hypothetical protein